MGCLMFFKKYVDRLVEDARKERSMSYRIVIGLVGAVAFVVVVPAALFVASYGLDKYVLAERARLLELGVGSVSAIAGLCFMAWSVLTFVTTGKGTAVPIAPPRKLIVSGPYKLCRNPMAFGAMLYYLGVGTYFGSLRIGIVMLLLTLIVMTCYTKLIEEKELKLKFGAEYEEYKRRTSFLLPKF
jgi:protein-S-isoprenylcysteine O-methyltransferase Ste14